MSSAEPRIHKIIDRVDGFAPKRSKQLLYFRILRCNFEGFMFLIKSHFTSTN
jgi:hypothetical protein